MYFQYDTNGVPLGFIYNGTQYFYITNQMGDVVGITDSTGTLIAQYEYDEWGNVLSTSENDIANINPIRYRGYYQDAETGYYYLQSRYYDASICRFINADVVEVSNIAKDSAIGANLFAYCNNNPINDCDPNGHFSFSSIVDAFNEAFKALGNICNYLLAKYKVSTKKYQRMTKYKSPSKIFKFVNENKRKIKNVRNTFSSIATFLSIVYSLAKVKEVMKNSKTHALGVAEILFSGLIQVVAYLSVKIVELILSHITKMKRIVKFVITTVVDYALDALSRSKIMNGIQNEYLKCIQTSNLTFLNYFKALFFGTKNYILSRI